MKKILITHSETTSVNEANALKKFAEKALKDEFMASEDFDIIIRPYEKVRDIAKYDAVVLTAPGFSRTLTKKAYGLFKKCKESNVPVYTRALRVLTPGDISAWQVKNMPDSVWVGEKCLVRIKDVHVITDNGTNVSGPCTGYTAALFPCMTC